MSPSPSTAVPHNAACVTTRATYRTYQGTSIPCDTDIRVDAAAGTAWRLSSCRRSPALSSCVHCACAYASRQHPAPARRGTPPSQAHTTGASARQLHLRPKMPGWTQWGPSRHPRLAARRRPSPPAEKSLEHRKVETNTSRPRRQAVIRPSHRGSHASAVGRGRWRPC